MIQISPNVVVANLPCGIPLVHLCTRGGSVETFGVAVKVGSRNDPEGLEGMAHFVEHTIFKGTSRRSSHHIINRMEAVGGELNAYTTKEETYIYSVAPRGNLTRAAELISDLLANSRFPEHQLDNERDVIIEEIDSYLDNPSEAVADDFDDLMFAGSSAGHNILGTVESVNRINSQSCCEFLKKNYVADRMVLFYAGPSGIKRVVSVLQNYFTDDVFCRHHSPESLSLSVAKRFDVRRPDGASHQAHTLVGTPVMSMFDDNRFAMSLLNNILGGPGMNSLLNVELRERRGLVYTADSALSLYSDYGLLTIYFGCSQQQVDHCREIVYSILRRLASETLTPRKLIAAKRQYKGQLAVASASAEQSVISIARSQLMRGMVDSMACTCERIDSVSAEEIMQVASLISPDKLSNLTLG